jgi:hypothetical protein
MELGAPVKIEAAPRRSSADRSAPPAGNGQPHQAGVHTDAHAALQATGLYLAFLQLAREAGICE